MGRNNQMTEVRLTKVAWRLPACSAHLCEAASFPAQGWRLFLADHAVYPLFVPERSQLLPDPSKYPFELRKDGQHACERSTARVVRSSASLANVPARNVASDCCPAPLRRYCLGCRPAIGKAFGEELRDFEPAQVMREVVILQGATRATLQLSNRSCDGAILTSTARLLSGCRRF